MRRGAQEIMDHPWFSSLNFTELYNKTVSITIIYNTYEVILISKRYKITRFTSSLIIRRRKPLLIGECQSAILYIFEACWTLFSNPMFIPFF